MENSSELLAKEGNSPKNKEEMYAKYYASTKFDPRKEVEKEKTIIDFFMVTIFVCAETAHRINISIILMSWKKPD
jgi:hypothetical protein